MSSACVLAIVAAWTSMFLRVVVMVRLVNASLAAVLGLPRPLSLVNHLWYKRARAASWRDCVGAGRSPSNSHTVFCTSHRSREGWQ